MSNPTLKQLEQQAEDRKRQASGGRTPGGSRHQRDPEAERQQRQAEREAERQRRQAERKAEEQRQEEEAKAEEERRRAEQEDEPAPPKSKTRSPSTSFYPDPANEEFLWAIREAATARREQIPATAVLRFALRRLQEQMTPSEIVRELGGPVQTGGKMGRPRR